MPKLTIQWWICWERIFYSRSFCHVKEDFFTLDVVHMSLTSVEVIRIKWCSEQIEDVLYSWTGQLPERRRMWSPATAEITAACGMWLEAAAASTGAGEWDWATTYGISVNEIHGVRAEGAKVEGTADGARRTAQRRRARQTAQRRRANMRHPSPHLTPTDPTAGSSVGRCRRIPHVPVVLAVRAHQIWRRAHPPRCGGGWRTWSGVEYLRRRGRGNRSGGGGSEPARGHWERRAGRAAMMGLRRRRQEVGDGEIDGGGGGRPVGFW
jgi:hypothetical protein